LPEGLFALERGGRITPAVNMQSRQPAWRNGALGFLVIGWLIVMSPGAAEAGPGPSEVVRNLYAQLLDTMQRAAGLGARGRYQKLEPVMLATFDVPFMARLSVGPSWSRLTPEQKRQAAAAYGRYVAALYATRFDSYSGERFEVLSEQKIKHGTLVRTQIIKSNGEPVSVNYILHDNDHAWQIRDAYLSGSISELATRRSEFANILRVGGIEGLITSLNKKADDLQG
jgi:phospholipid transport system substrate-binding protein